MPLDRDHHPVAQGLDRAGVGDLQRVEAGAAQDRDLVAAEEQVFGFAAFSGIYPSPGLIPGFFLKEIYVAASHRGRGIGRALIAEMAAMAKARGYGRIDWTADRDDPQLLDFYRGLGAVEQPKKVFFRLAGDALRR